MPSPLPNLLHRHKSPNDHLRHLLWTLQRSLFLSSLITYGKCPTRNSYFQWVRFVAVSVSVTVWVQIKYGSYIYACKTVSIGVYVVIYVFGVFVLGYGKTRCDYMYVHICKSVYVYVLMSFERYIAKFCWTWMWVWMYNRCAWYVMLHVYMCSHVRISFGAGLVYSMYIS